MAAYTLGCKVNQADTEKILHDFEKLGFVICDFADKADVYFINTCTVTKISDKKSRQMIGKARAGNPDAMIVAYGCYAQVEPQALSEISDLVIGTAAQSRAAQITADALGAGMCPQANAVRRSERTERTRAYLKIQDGCDRFCSYCIVPLARGKPVSVPPEEAEAKAKALAQKGFKEIVLTGIQIAAYGNDVNNLPVLFRRLNSIEGLERLRLGSLAPDAITEEFLQAAAETPKLCEHFHLSLQSGSDEILAKMNRRYTTADYAACVQRLRKIAPSAAITTDIIVGFPSETDAQFEETLCFVKEMAFAKVHVFPYSPKKGTAATEFPGQVPSAVKETRKTYMLELARQMTEDFYKSHIGKTVSVLIETQTDNMWEGYTRNYIPVLLPDYSGAANTMADVKLLRIQDQKMIGGLA